jgi:hypothetical protein
MKFNKYYITAVATTAATVLLNIVSFFFLPEEMVTQFVFSREGNRLSTLLYLILSALIVTLSAGMIIFSDKFQPAKKAKWFAANIVITALNIAVVIYNLTLK